MQEKLFENKGVLLGEPWLGAGGNSHETLSSTSNLLTGPKAFVM
jgi:hypothetical protein